MKLNSKQQIIIDSIISYCKENHTTNNMYQYKYYYSICAIDKDLLFDDNIIHEIKSNFKVGNVENRIINNEKIEPIRYIISVLKKAGYKIKYDIFDSVFIIIK